MNLHLEYTRRKGATDKWDASIMSTSRFKDDNFDFLSFGISYALGRLIESEEWKSPIDGLKTNVNKLNADIEGLSDDEDNDGVSDIFDKSYNTPLGVAVDGSGVPLDIDMDNVPDYKDADPFSARNVRVDENGVELDSDSDGVPDSKDLESNTKSGALVNQFGINMSLYSNNNIISVPTFPSIYFSSGSYNITDSNLSRLTIIALVLANNPDLNLLVIGHTDRTGDRSMNMELGLKRANAVVSKLVDIFQVDENRIQVKSEGEENPLFKDDKKITIVEGNDFIQDLNKINRRVDFQVID